MKIYVLVKFNEIWSDLWASEALPQERGRLTSVTKLEF